MKKSLFVPGVAVAALASCTNEEVMDVAENRAIGFSSFVNNTTKAVTDLDKTGMGENFYVIGYYGADNASMTSPVFTNEHSTAAYHWQNSQYYHFSAYSNGGERIADNVSFAPGTSNATLTITGYAVDDQHDLVAAISDVVNCTDATNQAPVGLTFKHLLSKVRFTFNTDAGEQYTLGISDIQFTANKQGDVNYTTSATTWSNWATSEAYEYDDIADLAIEDNLNSTSDGYVASVEKFVIPQAVPSTSGQQIAVTFTATLQGDGVTGTASKKFTANLTLPASETEWKAGYIYNYTTTITPEMISDELTEDMRIEFTVEEISEWETTDQEYTPTVQAGA